MDTDTNHKVARFFDNLDGVDAARVISVRPEFYSTATLRQAALWLDGDEDAVRLSRIEAALAARMVVREVDLTDPRPAGNGRIRRGLVIAASAALVAFCITVAARAGAKTAADLAVYHQLDAVE